MNDEYGGFRSLAVWQKSQRLAIEVAHVLRTTILKHDRRDRALQMIADQLVRAAGSVPANIAEGFGRYSSGAYRNHLSIARGSLFEAESWLDLLFQCEYISDDVKTRLVSQCHEVGRLLTFQMKQMDGAKPTSIREEGVAYEI